MLLHGLGERGMTVSVDPSKLKLPAAGMIMTGAVLALSPHDPGLACPLRSLTGVPCPLCGMTTSVEATLSGDVVGALAANPFGLLAVVIGALVLLWRKPRRFELSVGSITALVCASWAFQLFRFSIL